MRQKNSLFLALLVVLALSMDTPRTRGAQGVFIDPVLSTQLANTGPNDQVQAVVNFDPAVTSVAQLADAIQNLGAGTVTFNNLDSLGALATAAQINAVAGLAGVTEIYANRQLVFLMPEANAFIGADAVWNNLGITGAGIGVAILDSGIDGNHPDLAFGSKTVQNVKIVFNQTDVFTTKGKPATKPLFVEGLADTDTSSGHGTHCAGIAAGNGAASGGFYQGVAKDATLLGIGTGDTIFILWALAGFDYLLDHAKPFNVKVVNNSWGTSGGAQAWDPKDPINKATKKVHDRGITVVFAAGNDGPDQNTLNPYSVAPWVIGVAAGCKLVTPDPTNSAVHCADQTGQNRPAWLADFSSRGMPGSPLYHPDITAPGVHIVSTRASTGTVPNALDTDHA